MDKSWIKEDRLSVAYMRSVESFLNYACQLKRYGSKIPCPCVRCGNLRVLSRNDVKDHLYYNGFDPGYVVWTRHGEKHHEVDEKVKEEISSDEEEKFMSNYDEDLDDLFQQVEYQNLDSGDNELPKNVLNEFTIPLYDGCEADCLIKTVLQLFWMKAAGSWLNKSFDGLLAYMATILPKGNSLPSSMYEAKKIMTKVGLSYDKIHACRNHCVLYRNEFKDLSNCPRCGASRWKNKADGLTYRVGIP